MSTPLIININQQNCVDYDGESRNVNTFDRICRTCLTERGELRSLYENHINEMLMSCAAIQVTMNDGLPVNICMPCVLQITRAFSFKQQVEASDATLRQYIVNFNNIKDPIPSDILEINFTNPIAPQQTSATLPNKSEFFISDNSAQVEPFFDGKKDNKLVETKNPEEKPNDIKAVFEDNLGEISNQNDTASETEDTYCELCTKSFEDAQELKKHKKQHHSKAVRHTCNDCGKSFPYKVGLKTHMRTHGIGERKHVCSHCGKRFYEPNELMIHMRRHTGERPVVCETCGKTFADPRSLTKHLKIHTGEKNYQCDVCNKRFIHSYTLTAHRRVHTGEKPFVCSTCGHACATSTQLTLHTRTHTQEKPYICSSCPKRFASRSGLSTHQMTHTGERKFICSICGKGARTSSDLASHIRTHTGEKPYTCKIPQCTKAYKTHSQLSAHIRTHTDYPDSDVGSDVENETENNLTIMTRALATLTDSDFKSYFRLTKSSVQILLEEIGKSVLPTNQRRPAVQPKTAILIFLWMLVHDENFRKVGKRFDMGIGHIHRVFVTMSTALAKKQHKFIVWPQNDKIDDTIEEFRDIANWSPFPNVIGAVDFIHIPFPGPSGDSSYYNKFGFCSIILQGICNAKKEFINISVASPGSSLNPWSDASIYQELTEFIPPDTYVVANHNYEPDQCLLVPFKDIETIKETEQSFNFILAAKCAVVHKSFAMLKNNFRRLLFTKIQKVENLKSLIISACILHNLILKQDIDESDEEVETDFYELADVGMEEDVDDPEEQLDLAEQVDDPAAQADVLKEELEDVTEPAEVEESEVLEDVAVLEEVEVLLHIEEPQEEGVSEDYEVLDSLEIPKEIIEPEKQVVEVEEPEKQVVEVEEPEKQVVEVEKPDKQIETTQEIQIDHLQNIFFIADEPTILFDQPDVTNVYLVEQPNMFDDI